MEICCCLLCSKGGFAVQSVFLFFPLQLACSGTMPCPSSTSSISCLFHSSRSPQAQQCRVRSTEQLSLKLHTFDGFGSVHRLNLDCFPKVSSLNCNIVLCNVNQPFSRGLDFLEMKMDLAHSSVHER